MAKWSVLIVDDHPLVRKSLLQLLSYEFEFGHIVEVGSGIDAIHYLEIHHVDLIILDLNLKEMSGLEVLKHIRRIHSRTIIVVLTVSDSLMDIQSIYCAGGDGYLMKDAEPETIIDELKRAMSGEKIFSESQINSFLTTINKTTENNPIECLTKREKQILKEVANGKTNKAIADTLFISELTVKVHLKSILKKLNVTSRVGATLVYLANTSIC